MRTPLFISLCFVAVSGCGPLNALTDIYSGDAPSKTSAHTRNYVSNGDPEMLKDKNRPGGSADWKDLPE